MSCPALRVAPSRITSYNVCYTKLLRELFVEAWPTGAEPEEFNLLESGMIEESLYDLGADSLFLIGFVDDDIPYRRTIDKIRQNTPKSDQLIPVPGTERHVGMTQHVLRILKRPVFCPGRLMEEPKQLGFV